MRGLFDALYFRKEIRLRGVIPTNPSPGPIPAMPEVLFTVQLPGGETQECYSPSSVVRRYFAAGEEMTVAEFLGRSRKALAEASERVRAKFGFSCSSAAAQLTDIEQWTRALPRESTVRVLRI